MSKKFLLPLLALLATCGLMSACGQKGPLYLPQDPAAPVQPAAVAPGAAAPGTAAASGEEVEKPARADGVQDVEPAAEK